MKIGEMNLRGGHGEIACKCGTNLYRRTESAGAQYIIETSGNRHR